MPRFSFTSPADLNRADAPLMLAGKPSPYEPDAWEPYERWQAHVDAGRITGNAPAPPDVAARREAREKEWRRIFGV